MPLWPALTVPVEAGAFDVLAVTVWALGMIFEGIGDWQLSRFKADPANHGKVMDRGLWRYTRHPNYFGECLIWWGFYLFAVTAGAWWTVVGPLLLTYMLLKFSGVTLVEQTIVERRPAYRGYIDRPMPSFPVPLNRVRRLPFRETERDEERRSRDERISYGDDDSCAPAVPGEPFPAGVERHLADL